jgi:ribosomal protein S6
MDNIEESPSKKYILHFMLTSSLDSSDVYTHRTKINEIIEARDGKIEASVCQDSSRNLAYPIKKEFRGYFCESAFSVSPENIKDIEGDLKKVSQIMRYMIEFKKPAKSNIKPPRSERSLDKNIQDKPVPIQKPEEQAPILKNDEARERISMEEIDKKLDEIIKNI